MSMHHKPAEFEVTPERIREIMMVAHRERNAAIRQLFGSGFTAVKNAVRGAFGHKTAQARRPATNGASCG